jgi:NAD(P)-dependent dehydrogenase (short-subunit alcohol dehydrogenase family)
VSSFQDKVAIITGGAHGIGRATCHLLASEGVAVVVADINATNGQAVAAEIKASGGKALYLHTDVGLHEAIRASVEQTVETYGRLDYVVNNAYWSKHGTVEELSEEDWDRSFDIMLKAIFLFGKYAFPHMQAVGGGAMVNLASVHGFTAARRYGVYAAAKAGVINLTRSMALDYGVHGIRVNAVCPGWIITGDQRPPEKYVRRAAAIYALDRVGEPMDIAKVIRFLLSDDAGFVTGHALVADGGLTAQLQDSAAHAAIEHVLATLEEQDPTTE